MDNKKLDELIADLGYASMFLKQARMETKGADFQINRTRELICKVADALIKERGMPRRQGTFGAIHALPMDKKPKKMNGRAWTDTRREEVKRAARNCAEFFDLGMDQIEKLYDIVVDENENWDGEHVSTESLLTIMIARYSALGLSPSRNS